MYQNAHLCGYVEKKSFLKLTKSVNSHLLGNLTIGAAYNEIFSGDQLYQYGINFQHS